MVEERVDQRPLPRAGSGMDHQPRGLVDHDQVVVLVDDDERDVLGLGPGGGGRRQGDLDLLAAADLDAGVVDG